MNTQEKVAPWYRQPWLWFLLLFPGMAIGWSAFSVTTAYRMAPSMVSDDYSREGRGINQSFARDDRAFELGLAGDIKVLDNKIRLDLTSHGEATDYDFIVINLFHPTHERHDRIVQLNPEGNGIYTSSLTRDLDGRWYFDVRSPNNDWRLKGEVRLPLAQQPLTIHPARG